MSRKTQNLMIYVILGVVAILALHVFGVIDLSAGWDALTGTGTEEVVTG